MAVQNEIVAQIEEEFGECAADDLVKAYGGQKIQLPRTAIPSRLADALEDDVYEWLIECYGGDFLSVPSMYRLTARRRERFIADNPGWSLNALAAKLGITHRRVSQIKAALATT